VQIDQDPLGFEQDPHVVRLGLKVDEEQRNLEPVDLGLGFEPLLEEGRNLVEFVALVEFHEGVDLLRAGERQRGFHVLQPV